MLRIKKGKYDKNMQQMEGQNVIKNMQKMGNKQSTRVGLMFLE